MKKAAFHLFICILLMSSGSLAGPLVITTHRQLPAVRVSTPPVIDGNLNDACWLELPTAEPFYDEQTGKEPEDRTVAWIGYDDENIYVAFYCYDSEPHRISGIETRNDAGFVGEDKVRLRINPFNSRRGDEESRLTVNPLGTQNTNFAGGRANHKDWKGQWFSAARMVEDGWTTEMAIPWKNLTRPKTDGKPRTLGLNFERYHYRKDAEYYWSNIGPREDPALGGEWVGVVMPPATHVNPLALLAYNFSGIQENRLTFRTGLDARYQVNPFLTSVATVNPDFSNVERAVTSIDFSYTETLPAESRPFFLEGSSFFSSPVGGLTAFRSVRVPTFDAGFKAYGRLGTSTDAGVLAAADFGNRTDVVFTVDHDLSGNDSVGLQFTHLDTAGISNQVLSGGVQLRRGDWSFSGGAAGSWDKQGDGNLGSASLSWRDNRWNASVAGIRTNPGFRPRSGFVNFSDQKGASASVGYSNEYREGSLSKFSWSLDGYRYTRTDGEFFRDGASVGLGVDLRNQWTVSGSYSIGRFENLDDRFWTLSTRYPTLNKFQFARLKVASGTRGGRNYTLFAPELNYRFFNRLAVGVSREEVRRKTLEKQDILSVSYELAPDKSLGGRLVRKDGNTNWYLSFARSGYGGVEYFVILGDPNSKEFTDRLVFKVVWPL